MNLELSEFLKFRKDFSLGFLTTESFHPLSKNLSEQANTNVRVAIDTLKNIDVEALTKLKTYSQSVYDLQVKCQKIIKGKNKIFLSGCGATGRLALSMEKLYREKFQSDQVVGFMAGGDMALIKSIERFEDNKEFGKKQLQDLNLTENDLLLAITEGGETSFVIGTAEYAASICHVNPHFIYCNPDEQLMKIPRSAEILHNQKIDKLNLTIGAMAISGSTRMQATTVQMLAVGFALLYDHHNFENFEKDFEKYIDELISINYSELETYIVNEVEVYQNNGILHYQSNDHIALAILTDTTERSPTFNLKAFETKDDTDLALCYLSVGKGSDDRLAWKELLGRTPRALDWDHLDGLGSLEKLYQFDISHNSLIRRKKINKDVHVFKITDNEDSLIFDLESHTTHFPLRINELFFKHLSLKLLLNTHSTLVMGRMHRYVGNMMSYVRASNMKLIDRAIRYIEKHLADEGIVVSDTKVAELVFANLELKEEPIVTRVLKQLKEN